MNCPNCGAESTFGLNYCKRCGGSLFVAPQQAGVSQPSPPGVTGAAWALALATVAICLGGLGIAFSHAFDVMRAQSWGSQPPASDPLPLAITMVAFGSVTVFGVVALLIRLFTRFLTPAHLQAQQLPSQAGQSSQTGGSVAKLQNGAQLPAPPIIMPSVTEHTTRTFEQRRFKEHNE